MNFETLIEKLAEAGQRELVEALRELKPTDPAEAVMMRAFADAASTAGIAGIERLKGSILRLLRGDSDDFTLLEISDIAVASDLLAALQSAEADSKSAWSDLVTRTTEKLGPVLAGILKIAIG